MRYRALSATGDYTFGQGGANFLVNSPACVGQRVLTRLRLIQGEWFLNTSDGTPYATQILGKTTQAQRDAAIRSVILNTPGVTSIISYSSALVGRNLTVNSEIATTYGVAQIATSLSTQSAA